MEAKTITLKTLAVSIAMVIAMETLLRLVLAGKIASPLPALGVIRFLEALLLVIMVGRFEENPDPIGLSHSKIRAGLVRGLIWSAWFGIAAGILFLVLFAADINPLKLVKTPMPSAPLQIFVFFLVGGVIGPLWEEIFFRGIIFGFLRRWGLYAAILISTALFVWPHFDGSHFPVTQIVGGFVFAIAYEKERNQLAPITIHCLGNITMFGLTFFS